MRTRFLLILLVASLLSLSPLPLIGLRPTPVRGAVAGVVTISDQSFAQVGGATQAKAFFSVTAPHNVVGIEVVDPDLNTLANVVEQLPNVAIASTTATALGFSRAITLTETSASSGIFRGIVRLVKDTTDPCFVPSQTSDNAGCNDTIIGDNKYFGALVVADGNTITVTYNDALNASGVPVVTTATATVDLTPPTLTLVSPADGSSTNTTTVTFVVDATDTGSGVDPNTINLVRVSSPATGTTGVLPGIVSAPALSAIAKGFRATVLANSVPDQRLYWAALVVDNVGNTPKIVNDTDPAMDYCGNNATRGSRGNAYRVTVGTTMPTMNSAKTGVAGATDTRLQESGVTTYPDTVVVTPTITPVRQPPAGQMGFAAAPYPGQPVNCATFNKLTDDFNVNLVADPNNPAAKIPDPAKKGTADTSVRAVVNTGASGRMTLDSNSIVPADFSVSGVTAGKVDIGPILADTGQVVYLTFSPLRLATDATPEVLLVGPIADAAGNTIDPATLTDAQKALNLHRVPAATDGLVPQLALSMAISGNQATIVVTSSEALAGLPAVSVCHDANSNNRCDAAEDPAAVVMTAAPSNKYQGTYLLQAGDLGVKKVVATGTDNSGNQGTVAQILGTGPTRLNLQAPTAIRPGEQFSATAQVLLLPSLNVAANSGMPVTFNYVVYKLQSGGSQSGSATANTNTQGVATLTLTAPMETSTILIDAVFLDWGGLRASSNMWIVSVLPIVNARLTATASGGNVVFTLQDVYGNAMAGRTLTFLTTAGNLSPANGITNASGQVSLTLSGATEAVISASFGGWTSPQGWAYQPTMARITVTPG